MKLNKFEKRVVGLPLRFWIQNYFEAKLLTNYFFQENFDTKVALEIGCGFGNGISLIQKKFSPEKMLAIDFDPQMVEYATKRNNHYSNVEITVGDAESLVFKAEQFDKVFDFAVFHHIPDWQAAVTEVYRVLQPGGYFFIEELYRSAICNPISRCLFAHPQTNRFNHIDLLACLEFVGFEIKKQSHFFNLFGVILAQKPHHLSVKPK